MKEAIETVTIALPALDGRWRGLAQDLLARLCNKQREFPRAEQFAQDAIKDGLAMRERGQAIDLGRPYFTLGVAQKNQGKIDEAIDSMNKALAERDGKSPATSVALAGYLSIAGRHEEAHALFARIPIPPKTEREFMDYHANAAWFAGVSHDKAGVMTAAETALKAAKTFNHPGLYHYFQSEPDLDWLRGDEAFSGLLARYGH